MKVKGGKRAEGALQRRAKELKAINKMAIELTVAPSMADIYKLICERLKSITGALLTGVTSYDPQRQELRIEHICADSKLITKASEILGQRVKDLGLPLEPHLPKMMVSKRVKKVEGLHELTFGTIPIAIDNVLKKTLGIGDVYALALHHGGELMGTMSILMPKQQPLLSVEILEVFANLVATSLQRRQAEEALRKAHDELEMRVEERTKELAKANEELRESKEKYQRIIDNTLDIIYTCGPEGTITFVSPQISSMGHSPKEIVGQDLDKFLTKFIHPEDVEKVLSDFQRTMQAGEEFPITFRFRRKDGSYVYVEEKGKVIREGDKIVQLTGVMRDITERKRIEEELRESEEKYRAIFEQAADSIVLIDTKSRALVEFNDSAHESLGYTHEEFQKLKISDFEASESAEEVVKHIKKLVGEGADAFETKHRTKSGEIRDILVNTRVISIGGRDFALSIWRDITDRKKAEEKLAKAAAIDKARLKELEKFAILVVGRELKMVELKKRIKELELQTLLRES